jgi:hypothetical protein
MHCVDLSKARIPSQMSFFVALRWLKMSDNFLTRLENLHLCRELWSIDLSSNNVCCSRFAWKQLT